LKTGELLGANAKEWPRLVRLRRVFYRPTLVRQQRRTRMGHPISRGWGCQRAGSKSFGPVGSDLGPGLL